MNNLGVREYQSKLFTEWNTVKRNERSANDWLNKVEKTFREKGTFANEDLTFAAFVEMKKKTHLKEAIITDGKRVSGLKGFDSFVVHYLNPLVDSFGKAKIRLIKAHDIDVYRNERLQGKTYKGTTRTIATVNRELSLLRKIFNLAVRDGVINFAPKFQISMADEGARERILDYAEQARLIEAFEYRNKQGRQTVKHLKPLVIFLLDTAVRFGEAQKLQWSDVNFDTGIITLRASNTKTAKERLIPMLPRVKDELTRLHEARTNESVFNVRDVKNGWKTLCKVAEIEGCRIHDLRHSAITNFVRSGMRTEIAMAISGHSELRTFRRYLNFKANDFIKAFEDVEAYKIRRETPELVSEASN
ncbi:MAG TPA: site-specific integrase [Pyrinomonadaceae bacterium]